MVELKKRKVQEAMHTTNIVGMSVCNSCAACGCGGSRCVSTCKGCHDKDVKIQSVSDVYSKK